ncbi:T9SS type A sorting domain-containing protein [bacterium SCSIO 12741]|nr:T9SS type A sorting domain-containing protein [bacterium SCSIO 12741]
MKKLSFLLLFLGVYATVSAQRSYLQGMDLNTFNLTNAHPCFCHSDGALMSANHTQGNEFLLNRVLYNGDTAWVKWFKTLDPMLSTRVLKTSRLYKNNDYFWLVAGYEEISGGIENGLVMIVDDHGQIIKKINFDGVNNKNHVLDILQAGNHIYITGHSRDILNETYSNDGRGFIIKLDLNLNIVWDYWFDSGATPNDYDMAEDITYIETRGNGDVVLFVTGSRNKNNTTGQSTTLALFLEDKGSTCNFSDVSFVDTVATPAFRQWGADALVHDQKLYLLWNNEDYHHMQIMPFDISMQSPQFNNSMVTDVNGGHSFSTGFQLFADPSDPEYLLAFGYGAGANSATVFLRPFYAQIHKDGMAGDPNIFFMEGTYANARPIWHPNDIYSLMPYYMFETPSQGGYESGSNYTPDFVDFTGDHLNALHYHTAGTSPSAVENFHLTPGSWHCGEYGSTGSFGSFGYKPLPPVTFSNSIANSYTSNVWVENWSVAYLDCQPITPEDRFGYGPDEWNGICKGTYCFPSSGGGGGILFPKKEVTSTEEAKEEIQNLSVFPNPAADYVQINGLQEDVSTDIYLYDLNGATVAEFHGQSAENTRLNTQEVQAGTYILKVNQGDAQSTLRVIIQK